MSGKTTNHFPVQSDYKPGFLLTPTYFLNRKDFSEFLDGCSIKSPSNGDSIRAMPARIIELYSHSSTTIMAVDSLAGN